MIPASKKLLPWLLLSAPGVSFAEGENQRLTLMNTQKPAATSGQQQTVQQSEVLYDIHGPISLPEQLPYLAIGGVILALLLVLAAVLFWLKKRVKPGPTPLPPWEMALNELAEAKHLQISGQGLLYMERASQVLRRYIESRFAIRSTRQTTREFLTGLNHTANNSPLERYRPELQTCLEQADMAKFAHRVPDLGNMGQMEHAVTDFVKKTEPSLSPAGGRS